QLINLIPLDVPEEPTPYTISVGDTIVNETAGTVTFTVLLNLPAPAGGISVDFQTADITAVAGVDYTAPHGTPTFNTGPPTRPVTVNPLNNALTHGHRPFALTLRNVDPLTAPLNGLTARVIIIRGRGTATIVDDDGPLTVNVGDGIQLEPNTGL